MVNCLCGHSESAHIQEITITEVTITEEVIEKKLLSTAGCVQCLCIKFRPKIIKKRKKHHTITEIKYKSDKILEN
jgi:hypothetical protein